jgi:hypothetical protein
MVIEVVIVVVVVLKVVMVSCYSSGYRLKVVVVDGTTNFIKGVVTTELHVLFRLTAKASWANA